MFTTSRWCIAGSVDTLHCLVAVNIDGNKHKLTFGRARIANLARKVSDMKEW